MSSKFKGEKTPQINSHHKKELITPKSLVFVVKIRLNQDFFFIKIQIFSLSSLKLGTKNSI